MRGTRRFRHKRTKTARFYVLSVLLEGITFSELANNAILIEPASPGSGIFHLTRSYVPFSLMLY